VVSEDLNSASFHDCWGLTQVIEYCLTGIASEATILAGQWVSIDLQDVVFGSNLREVTLRLPEFFLNIV
jgi:hypothetical protein